MSKLKNDWEKMNGYGGKDSKGIVCEISYSGSRHKFRVDVSYEQEKLSEEFAATHVPVYGIDVSDCAQIDEIAEKLAVELEQKLGL